MDVFTNEGDEPVKGMSKRGLAFAKFGAFSLGILMGLGARHDERPAVRALGIFGVVTAILVALSEVASCTISFGNSCDDDYDCDCGDDCGCGNVESFFADEDEDILRDEA